MFDFNDFLEREERKHWSDAKLQEYNLLVQYYERELTIKELEDYTGKTLKELERIYN